jgi:glycopeptide antibiotics resistance protein
MLLRHNLLGIIWALCISLVCMMPSHNAPNRIVSHSVLELFTFDKVAHAIVFALLVLFLVVGFLKQRTYGWLQKNARKAAFFIAFSLGGALELIQGMVFDGRNGDVLDFIANSLGCFLGLLLFYSIYRRRDK